jgi:HD domain-containing protein
VSSPDPDGWTSRVAPQVGSRLGLEGEELEVLTRAAQLHDIGKVALPEELLRKSQPPTTDEIEFVRRHVLVGERLLRAAEPLGPVARVVSRDARALGRPRLSGRAERPGDPARGAHHLRLRDLRGHDRRAQLPDEPLASTTSPS